MGSNQSTEQPVATVSTDVPNPEAEAHKQRKLERMQVEKDALDAMSPSKGRTLLDGLKSSPKGQPIQQTASLTQEKPLNEEKPLASNGDLVVGMEVISVDNSYFWSDDYKRCEICRCALSMNSMVNAAALQVDCRFLQWRPRLREKAHF